MIVVISRRHNPKKKATEDSRTRAIHQDKPTAPRILTIEDLVISLRIPAERRHKAAWDLRSHLRYEGELPPEFVEGDIGGVQRLGSLGNEILRGLRNLSDGAIYFLTEDLNDTALPSCLNTLEYMVSKVKGIKHSKRAPNRPSGIKQPKLQELVSSLYDIAERHGGKLTLSKGESAKPIGSFPDAIIFMAPMLPSFHNLKIPSYQTLRRMRNVAKEEHSRRR
jgi:hypothetical protein